MRHNLLVLVLGVFLVGCHRTAPVRNAGDRTVIKDTVGVGPVVKDTVRVNLVVKDTSGVLAFFKDTAGVSALGTEGQTFKLQTAAQRQSLRATIRREYELWQAHKPESYRYLLRVGCFCPGTRGWLLIEVRENQPLRAWDRTGKSVALTDWNTLSIDDLYGNLERSIGRNREVQIAFDPHWHFPKYVRTTAVQGPDSWSVIDARGLRPI
jgi:hypothetical protein